MSLVTVYRNVMRPGVPFPGREDEGKQTWRKVEKKNIVQFYDANGGYKALDPRSRGLGFDSSPVQNFLGKLYTQLASM